MLVVVWKLCGCYVQSTKQTPLDILIEEKKGRVLWSLVVEMNVDITWLDKVHCTLLLIKCSSCKYKNSN